MKDTYQVTTGFITQMDGREVNYRLGELVDGDDPALKRFPEYFGPPAFPHRKTESRVEQATAAPGQKRG